MMLLLRHFLGVLRLVFAGTLRLSFGRMVFALISARSTVGFR
jgi:hypothetical protein